MIITVRTTEGKIRRLHWHNHAPLRLGDPLDSGAAAARGNDASEAQSMPGDVLEQVLGFLGPKDLLSADSSCRRWRRAARPLWKSSDFGSGAGAAEYFSAEARVRGRWGRIRGFLPSGTSFNGSASDGDIGELRELVRPWVLPPAFVASWMLHDGETHWSGGMYLRSRLLSASEIADEIRLCRRDEEMSSLMERTGVIRLPLLSPRGGCPLLSPRGGCRRIVMELMLARAFDPSFPDLHSSKSGRIVLTSGTAFEKHIKVLSTSWEGFLTTI